MDTVEFNEPDFTPHQTAVRAKEPSALTRLVLSMKLAEDERGAQRVLIIVLLISIGILAVVMFAQFSSAPEEIVQPPMPAI
jgi:hypothetical protein